MNLRPSVFRSQIQSGYDTLRSPHLIWELKGRLGLLLLYGLLLSQVDAQQFHRQGYPEIMVIQSNIGGHVVLVRAD